MCDYSLHNVVSRPAKIGDKLVTTHFPNAITRGFCDPRQPRVAVCLLPGTELAFEKEVERDAWFAFLPAKKLPHKVARFRQINLKHPAMHHDALEFADGKIVLVTDLCEGQHATVLQLPTSGGPRLSPENKWCQREFSSTPDSTDCQRAPVCGGSLPVTV